MAGQGLGGQYLIKLRSTTGREVTAEFRIRRDTVEVWYQDRCKAVLDRDSFRIWLERNPGPYAVDDVMWACAPDEPVVLMIRDSGCWLIPASVMAGLRARV
jgi:hypothetical protein